MAGIKSAKISFLIHAKRGPLLRWTDHVAQAKVLHILTVLSMDSVVQLANSAALQMHIVKLYGKRPNTYRGPMLKESSQGGYGACQ